MESTTPIYPSAPGSFWLPYLTPEGSPQRIDELSEVSCPQELRNFSNPPPPQLLSGPLAKLHLLQEQGVDLVREFSTTPDHIGSPFTTMLDEIGSPSASDDGDDADEGEKL